MNNKKGGWLHSLKQMASRLLRKKASSTKEVSHVPIHVLERHGPQKDNSSVIDVIFVHGLNGDPVNTWTSPTTSEFWPSWLNTDFANVQVWTLKWPSSSFSSAPSAGMSIVDVANATLHLLVSRYLGRRSVIFISHSMGGILVKEMLHSAATLKDKEWEKFLKHVVGVVFMGTPHTGSALANVMKLVPKLPSLRAHELGRNDSALRHLQTWYRTNAPSLNIVTLTFFETRTTAGVLVVDQSSADSGVSGAPVAVDANHSDICKPASREELSYVVIKGFLERRLSCTLYRGWTNDIFRLSYLHSNEQPVVFGGRQQQIAQLNDWLSTEFGPRRMLVTGPTGRGKSALLVRWIEQLTRSDETAQWHFIFVPISMRFSTARAVIYYKLLAEELAIFLKYDLGTPATDPEYYYRSKSAELLSEANDSGRKLVVVLDGLDEAQGEPFSASIFPGNLQSSMKLLVSARLLAGDVGAAGWKARLEWKGAESNVAVLLDKLDQSGVRDAIANGGVRLETLPPLLPDRLLELSLGEPMLVQLYVEDIVERLRQENEFSLDQLTKAKPGYASYMANWITLQEQAWKATGEQMNKPSIDAALGVLSAAFGPLQGDEFNRLVAANLSEAEPLAASAYIQPIQRFVIGSGTIEEGYVLSHPMLGQYLAEEYFSPGAINVIHKSFVEWGDRIIDRPFSAGISTLVSPYLLQHYVQHMRVVGPTLNRCSALIAEFWARAWELFEGGFRGFSSDVLSVLECIDAIQVDQRSEVVAIKLRACLTLASIRSIGTNIPSHLLNFALEDQLLTWKQVSHFIELQQIENQSQSFSEVYAHIPIEERQLVKQRILQTVDIGNRILQTCRILDLVVDDEREQLIDICSLLVSEIDNPMMRFSCSVELCKWSPALLEELLSNESSTDIPVEHLGGYANQYARLSAALDTSGRPDLRALNCSFQLIERIPDPLDQFHAIWNLAVLCGVGSITSILGRIAPLVKQSAELRIAVMQTQTNSTMNAFSKSTAMSSLVKLALLSANDLDDSEYAKLINLTLTSLDGIDEWDRASTLSDLLPVIRSSHFDLVFDRAVALAGGLSTANNRAHALLALIKFSKVEVRARIVKESLKNSLLIEDCMIEMRVRIALHSVLSAERRSKVRSELNVAINQVRYVINQAQLLMMLAPSEEESTGLQLQENAFQLVHLAYDTYTRVNETCNMFGKAPPQLRARAYAECMTLLKKLNDGGISGMAVRQVANHFGDLWSISDLEFAEQLITNDKWLREIMLCSIVPIAARLGVTRFVEEAKSLSVTSNDPSIQFTVLSAISPPLTDAETYLDLVERAWAQSLTVEPELKQAATRAQLLPLFDPMDTEKRIATIDFTSRLPGNWNILVMLATQATSDEEREGLLHRALDSAELEAAEVRISAASQIVLKAMTNATRMRAFELLVSHGNIPRSSFLLSLTSFPELIDEIGGEDLVRRVIHDVEDVCKIWP